jgi:glycosyltransferase involved in cell wall biosynthesis
MRLSVVTGGLLIGGSTTFLCNLGGELVRRKISTEVLSFEQGNPLGSDFARLKIPVLCPDERLIFEDRVLTILGSLSRSKPTVVLANLSPVSFEVLRYLPKGVLRVGITHSDDPLVYEAMQRYAACLDVMAAVSETIQSKLAAMAEFADVPVRYLPYGVPMPDGASARQFHGPLRILYMGRLGREQKRVHLFPDILAGLESAGIPFHWTIAGEGVEAAWLQGALSRTSQTRGKAASFSVRGAVSYADVPGLLAEHDVFLLASDYEGMPLALLEAMGSGLVPVVSDLPSGIRQVVDEQTGCLVSPDDIPGYARAIIRLHERRDEMARLSASAREKVRREYSIRAMTDRWLDTVQESPGSPAWPQHWRVQPPLAQPGFRFSPLGRAMRRLKLRLRAG